MSSSASLFPSFLLLLLIAASHAFLMQYVSFVEILGIKAISSFIDAGFTANEASRYATFAFFTGVTATWVLGKFTHWLAHIADLLQRHKVSRAGKDASWTMKISNNSLQDLLNAVENHRLRLLLDAQLSSLSCKQSVQSPGAFAADRWCQRADR